MQAAQTHQLPPAPDYRVATHGHGGLPLFVEANGQPDVERLCGWLRDQPEWIEQTLTEHGALLFRGFDVTEPSAFERVARAVDDDLKKEYLGTSPRDALTEYVFSASELPGFYPIPQHCEMTFIANPPRRVFFCCLVEPEQGSGETPLADFRKVYRDLDPAVRERFEKGGIRIVRNYAGPEGSGKLDPWKLKRWDEMFQTADRTVVEAKCHEQGFDASWGPRSTLRLVSTQPAVRRHPVTGEPVWHNHSQVFHLSAAPGEYARIYELRPRLRHWLTWRLSQILVDVQRRTREPDAQSMHCTYMDGTEIAGSDMEAVREAIWKNLVITPWRRGDIVAIDNHSVAHGRLPYRGPRQIAVCWA